MSKHTPGPWKAEQYESEGFCGWQFSACGSLLPLNDATATDFDEAEANARLIAAAPRMLAALRKARDCILIDRTALADCSTGPDGIDEDAQAGVAEYDETLAVIAAAISQAEGQ